MAIETLTQKVSIADITAIIVTDPVLDEDSGDYVREVRFYTGADPTDSLPVFTVRVTGASQNSISITAPEQKF